MDPNANLEEQRAISRRLLGLDGSDGRCHEQDTTRLAELVIALDEWISGGGFLPRNWLKSCAVPRVITLKPCCNNEDREINGGCRNCGDPSL